jgi:nitroreductase
MNISEISELIKKRRSIFPPMYNEVEISKETIQQVLENANFAPTHKLTEPWRFKILRGSARGRLAAFLVEHYKLITPLEQQTEKKLRKTAENPLLSSCVIAICMKQHQDTVPEWEEVAAVAMAVQNMWLTCTALGIGSYWSTPNAIEHLDEPLGLAHDERCLGLFYMGYSDVVLPEGKRNPIGDKVEWIED